MQSCEVCQGEIVAAPALVHQKLAMRNLALAWVLTLPASIVIAALLYWVFRSIGG